MALVCWKDTIVVGLESCIIILDAITGSQVAVLSGHTGSVRSLNFSFDGALLVSGSRDETAKLWDLQTGGVIKTFCGHTGYVLSVSISPDSTTLASGSWDKSIRLWGVWTGECFCIIDGHNDWVTSVCFSPTNSQLLVSSFDDDTVKQWDINGCQVGPTLGGRGVTFSLDGAHLVSWWKKVATVQNTKFEAVIKLVSPGGEFECCCFSPSGEFVAGAAGSVIYVWNITYSDPHLFKTFVGHVDDITALTFSSSLISVSGDRSVRFWQVGASPTDPVTTDVMSTLPTSASIVRVSLQARKGIAISSDSAGVVKNWDISTGLCKASFQTLAKGLEWRGRDAQLIEGRLIFVWHVRDKIHIWDIEKDELLQTLDAIGICDLRISGDGSKVFCLTNKSIQALSIWTGEAVGRVEFKDNSSYISYLDPLHADGSRVWVCFWDSSTKGWDSLTKGWDFGILDSSPIQLSGAYSNRLHLNFIWPMFPPAGPPRIGGAVTGTNVFQLVGRYAKPRDARWDGQYLVAGYKSGEVLILDFNQYLSRYM